MTVKNGENLHGLQTKSMKTAKLGFTFYCAQIAS